MQANLLLSIADQYACQTPSNFRALSLVPVAHKYKEPRKR